MQSVFLDKMTTHEWMKETEGLQLSMKDIDTVKKQNNIDSHALQHLVLQHLVLS